MLEKDVKKSLKEYLTKIGAYQYWPVPTGLGATTIDVLLCYKGRFYGIECKRNGKRATPAQIDVMNRIVLSGGRCWVEDESDLSVTKYYLRD